MDNKNELIIRKILRHCDHIEESKERFGDSFNDFRMDFSYQDDCCMSLLQIGELCKVLSMDFRSSHGEISWRGWCGIRDILAHRYDEIDLEIAWNTIRSDLPVLKDYLIMLIKK